jgi:hypothetical protein
MRTVSAACGDLVGVLKAAGFTGSSVDPAEVNPPAAVYVQPRSIGGLTLGGGVRLLVWLYVIAPDVDPVHAMRLLDDGLAGLLDLDLDLADDEEPIDLNAAIVLPHTTTPLPAYRLAVHLEL